MHSRNNSEGAIKFSEDYIVAAFRTLSPLSSRNDQFSGKKKKKKNSEKS
jgi:hypothetical protein